MTKISMETIINLCVLKMWTKLRVKWALFGLTRLGGGAGEDVKWNLFSGLLHNNKQVDLIVMILWWWFKFRFRT